MNQSPPPGFEHFLRQAGRYRLLTSAEEVDLARRIAACRAVEELYDIAEAGRDPELHQIVEMGIAARRRLIEHNLRLVVNHAKQYSPFLSHLTLAFEDVVQEGMRGLIRATELYDPCRGYRFSTYATWWIRQSMERGIANTGRTIRLPVHIGEQLHRLRRARRLCDEAGVPATSGALARMLEISTAQVDNLLEVDARIRTTGLDECVGGSTLRRSQLLSDPRAGAQLEQVERAEIRRMIAETLDRSLSAREREILELRFGLRTNQEAATLEEVGERFGLTRERIRQIQRDALGRLASNSGLRRALTSLEQ